MGDAQTARSTEVTSPDLQPSFGNNGGRPTVRFSAIQKDNPNVTGSDGIRKVLRPRKREKKSRSKTPAELQRDQQYAALLSRLSAATCYAQSAWSSSTQDMEVDLRDVNEGKWWNIVGLNSTSRYLGFAPINLVICVVLLVSSLACCTSIVSATVGRTPPVVIPTAPPELSRSRDFHVWHDSADAGWPTLQPASPIRSRTAPVTTAHRSSAATPTNAASEKAGGNLFHKRKWWDIMSGPDGINANVFLSAGGNASPSAGLSQSRRGLRGLDPRDFSEATNAQPPSIKNQVHDHIDYIAQQTQSLVLSHQYEAYFITWTIAIFLIQTVIYWATRQSYILFLLHLAKVACVGIQDEMRLTIRQLVEEDFYTYIHVLRKLCYLNDQLSVKTLRELLYFLKYNLGVVIKSNMDFDVDPDDFKPEAIKVAKNELTVLGEAGVLIRMYLEKGWEHFLFNATHLIQKLIVFTGRGLAGDTDAGRTSLVRHQQVQNQRRLAIRAQRKRIVRRWNKGSSKAVAAAKAAADYSAVTPERFDSADVDIVEQMGASKLLQYIVAKEYMDARVHYKRQHRLGRLFFLPWFLTTIVFFSVLLCVLVESVVIDSTVIPKGYLPEVFSLGFLPMWSAIIVIGINCVYLVTLNLANTRLHAIESTLVQEVDALVEFANVMIVCVWTVSVEWPLLPYIICLKDDIAEDNVEHLAIQEANALQRSQAESGGPASPSAVRFLRKMSSDGGTQYGYHAVITHDEHLLEYQWTPVDLDERIVQIEPADAGTEPKRRKPPKKRRGRLRYGDGSEHRLERNYNNIDFGNPLKRSGKGRRKQVEAATEEAPATFTDWLTCQTCGCDEIEETVVSPGSSETGAPVEEESDVEAIDPGTLIFAWPDDDPGGQDGQVDKPATPEEERLLTSEDSRQGEDADPEASGWNHRGLFCRCCGNAVEANEPTIDFSKSNFIMEEGNSRPGKGCCYDEAALSDHQTEGSENSTEVSFGVSRPKIGGCCDGNAFGRDLSESVDVDSPTSTTNFPVNELPTHQDDDTSRNVEADRWLSTARPYSDKAVPAGKRKPDSSLRAAVQTSFESNDTSRKEAHDLFAPRWGNVRRVSAPPASVELLNVPRRKRRVGLPRV